MLLQIWYNKKIPKYVQLCMESAKRAYPNHKYTLLTENEYPEYSYTVSADIQRLQYASEYDDLIYIDADCYIFTPYKPTSRILPSFAGGRSNDIFYFMNNGNTHLFKGLYKKALDDLTVKKVSPYSYGHRAFRRIDSDMIPRDTYYHLHAQRWTEQALLKKLKKRLL